MKKILSLLLLGVSVATAVSAQSVDDIVAKHITARGGLEKIKSLQSMRAEANISIQGMDIPLKLYAIDKKAYKLEIYVMDQVGYQLVTDTEGWSYLPFQGQNEPQKFSAEQLAASQSQLDLQGPLVDYKAKNIKIESGGKETVDGKECSVLKITRPNGEKETIWLDDKFLVAKKTGYAKVNGSDVEQTLVYHSYQTTSDGYVYAASWTAANGGEVAITKYEPNAKMEDTVFKP